MRLGAALLLALAVAAALAVTAWLARSRDAHVSAPLHAAGAGTPSRCTSVLDCGGGACVRGSCVECAGTAECGGRGARCEHGACLPQCGGDADCVGVQGTPHCVRGGCVACVRRGDCSGAQDAAGTATPYCAPTGTCVACVSSAACPPGLSCVHGTCARACTRASDCPFDTPACVNGACAALTPGTRLADGLVAADGKRTVECLTCSDCAGAFVTCTPAGTCARSSSVFFLSAAARPPVASRTYLAIAPAYPELPLSALTLVTSNVAPALVRIAPSPVLGSGVVEIAFGTPDGAAFAVLMPPQPLNAEEGSSAFLLTQIPSGAPQTPRSRAQLTDDTGAPLSVATLAAGMFVAVWLGSAYVGADGAPAVSPFLWSLHAP